MTCEYSFRKKNLIEYLVNKGISKSRDDNEERKKGLLMNCDSG